MSGSDWMVVDLVVGRSTKRLAGTPVVITKNIAPPADAAADAAPSAMSFREQRNFIEILRNLGYGHTIRYASRHFQRASNAVPDGTRAPTAMIMNDRNDYLF